MCVHVYARERVCVYEREREREREKRGNRKGMNFVAYEVYG